MEACPVGYYMRGHNVGANKSTCCPYPASNRPTTYVVDGHGEPPSQQPAPEYFTP
jgi:hypothetical protein